MIGLIAGTVLMSVYCCVFAIPIIMIVKKPSFSFNILVVIVFVMTAGLTAKQKENQGDVLGLFISHILPAFIAFKLLNRGFQYEMIKSNQIVQIGLVVFISVYFTASDYLLQSGVK